MIKVDELREKNIIDLQSLEHELLKEQFNLRMQKGSQQLTKSHLLKQVHRNIARVKTILNEKKSKV